MIRRDTAVRERTVASRGFLVDVIRTSGVIRSGERGGRPCEAQEGAADKKEGNEERSAIFEECGISIGEFSAAFSVTYSNRARYPRGPKEDLRKKEIEEARTKENKNPRGGESNNDEGRHESLIDNPVLRGA